MDGRSIGSNLVRKPSIPHMYKTDTYDMYLHNDIYIAVDICQESACRKRSLELLGR